MAKTARKVSSSQNFTTITVRTGGSTAAEASALKSQLDQAAAAAHPTLSRRSSSTLSLGRAYQQQPQQAQGSDSLRTASLPPESMYRQALRVNHGAARPADGAGRTAQTPPAGSPGIVLDVHHVQSGARRRVAFPPGIMVGQARDLCMLRFGVWHEVMNRLRPDDHCSAASQSTTGTAASSSAASQASGASRLSRLSTTSSASSSASHGHYALYWPGTAQWLDSKEPLARYALAPGDRIELQDRGAFIPAPASDAGDSCDGDAASTGSGAAAELEAQGHVHYLFEKGLAATWKPCWLELRGAALAGYRRPRKIRGGQALERSPRDAPLLHADLSRGFQLVDQSGQATRAPAPAADLAGSVSSLASAASHVAGGGGAPLIIRTAGAVLTICMQSAADHEYWRRMLSLAQVTCELAAGPGLRPSGSMGTIARPRSALGDAPRPAWGAVPLLRRPPAHQRRPLPPAAEPHFAGVVRVRIRGQEQPAGAQALAFCVVAARTLFVFPRAYAGPMDAAAMAAAADFAVDLAGARLQVLRAAGPGPGSDAPFVLCVLRVAPGSASHQTEVALAFDVDGRAQCARWTDALRAIGGIDDVSMPLDPPPSAAPATERRRSRSFVSAISRAEWPMPPATLPALPGLVARGRAIAADALSLTDVGGGGGGGSSDQPAREERRPSLLSSRLPWLRRAASRPSPTDKPSAAIGADARDLER
ncbi:hypothetical protein H4R18_004748 [Coemansia javaensis]|uniref:PH domain-containing protein n=1 Tax=Coemansia javaensis TaxID=2761396 RepID=A0A9W8H419_9FUNG|nr:hypothetical protein H4R18_004748 [Coemansia javaensis]